MAPPPPSSNPPAPGELRIEYAFTTQLADPDKRARCLGLLSDEERARQQRFRFARDQDSYLLAHALVRRTLSELLGVPPAALAFEAGEHGRPELIAPRRAPRLRFNLSHTEGLVACAFAVEHDVGVDVEHVDRRVEIEQLARSVFSEAERAALFALPTAQAQRVRFFELWTLKEAYIKAVGIGLGLPLQAISLQLDGRPGPTIGFGPELADDPARWFLYVGPLGDGHMLAAALAAAPTATSIVERDPGAP